MKKQMLKKVYAMVLAITLIGSQQCSSVLANDIAQIYSGVTQNTEIPDYDYWMAQTIMNGIDNNGNSLYSTFRSFSEPVYRQLGEYLLDDKPLVSISTAWSIYFNSEYRNQLTNMQKYVYEMLLMDYLKYDAFGEDKNKELTNSKTDFALKIYDAIGEELNDKKESYINGGAASDIINWIYHKENVSTATDLINICKGQNKYRQSLINNQLKYADIYFAKYKKADEEIIPTARQKSITVDKGKTKQFVIDNVLSGAKVVYSSSNNKVAYVNSKGVIKGVKSGTATITAKVVQNKKTYYVNLAVKVCDPQKDWYKKVLNSKSGTYYVKYYDGYQGTKMDKKKVKRSDFTYYKLIDLNNDGVKELLLATDRSVLWGNRVLLLTYYNGKVLPLICFEGAGARGRQLINKKTLILANSGSDFSSQIYLSVVKGKLKILQQTYRQNMKKGYPPQYLYKVNNKKVSESIYQKAIDKYGLSIAKQIEFKRVW